MVFSLRIGRGRQIQTTVEVVAQSPGEFRRDPYSMVGRHVARVVGRPSAARSAIEVELEAALAARVEIVGVDLDLVHDRERAGCRIKASADQEEKKRTDSHPPAQAHV